jgi:hypothetical protein
MVVVEGEVRVEQEVRVEERSLHLGSTLVA